MIIQMNNKLVGIGFLMLVLLGGCGYHLGTTLPEGMNSIHIPIFKNLTTEAGLEFDMTDQTIERFLIDGSLDVVEEDQADVILYVDLIEYYREAVSYTGKDYNVAREYRLHVKARCSLYWKNGEKVFTDRIVHAETDFIIGDDLTESERTARGFAEGTIGSELPTLEEDLAQSVLETVIENW